MVSHAHTAAIDKEGGRLRFGRDLELVFRLLEYRQFIRLLWLIAERVAIGLCDLLLAFGLYLLFVRLQGGSTLSRFWWTPKTILSIAVVAALLVVARACLDMLSTWYASRQIQALYKNFLFRLSSGYCGMRWEHFIQRNRSELLNHAVHTAREAAEFYHRCVEIVASIIVVIIMIVAIVYQSPRTAAGLGTAVILLYAVHRFIIRKKLQLAAFTREKSLRALQRYLADMLSSGKEIRAYRNQQFFFSRIDEQADRLALSNQRVLLLPQIARILADQGVILLFLCTVIAVQLQHGDTRQLLSLLVFYFVLSRRLFPTISQISLIAGQMEGSYENIKIVASELNDCFLYGNPTMPVLLPSTGFVLELEQVSFSFDEGTPIVRDVNFRIRNSEIVVLRGASGSGKSSLLNLIAGVSQPTGGVVRVDRKRIAYVPQEVPLLDDTIRNNLLFGLPGRSDEELMMALAIARLEECVVAQPLGLETRIGDNGILFSGGERQRLGLSRAILRGATLLLLDEATSALDEKNELQILDNLRTFGIAILLVTHRTRAERCGEREFYLQDGCLVEKAAREIPIEIARVTF